MYAEHERTGVWTHARSHELPKDVSAWLHIDDDGHITVFTGKVEMGQNIRTSLAQQIAGLRRRPRDANLEPLLDEAKLEHRRLLRIGIDDERAKTLIMAARAHWFESAEQ